jgi:hypothetical protein
MKMGSLGTKLQLLVWSVFASQLDFLAAPQPAMARNSPWLQDSETRQPLATPRLVIGRCAPAAGNYSPKTAIPGGSGELIGCGAARQQKTSPGESPIQPGYQGAAEVFPARGLYHKYTRL